MAVGVLRWWINGGYETQPESQKISIKNSTFVRRLSGKMMICGSFYICHEITKQLKILKIKSGAPIRSWTWNLLIRSQPLYPIELWVQPMLPRAYNDRMDLKAPHHTFFAALLKQVITATVKLVKSVLTNPPCHRPIRLSEKLKRLQAENSPITELLWSVLRPVGSWAAELLRS